MFFISIYVKLLLNCPKFCFKKVIVSYKLPPKVLIIECEKAFNITLCNSLERNWFDVLKAYNAEQALRSVNLNIPNVAIISSMLQDISAAEMAVRLRKIKQLDKLPIIFLLNTGESSANYNHLNNDLVEFAYRSCTPNELITAIKSLLRRSQTVLQNKVIRYKDISLDLLTFKVFKNNEQIHLGPTEFKILQLLVQKPKEIFSRQQIIDYVWGSKKTIESRTVDVHINRLRILIKSPKGSSFIKTVRSSGYCINLPGEVD